MTMSTSEQPAPLPDIDEWKEGHEEDMSIIRGCYCPNCGDSAGVTTMLPTRVPYFREIIIMNLICASCHFRNAEINFGGEIQEQGERLTLTLTEASDLNRQIIKSDSATFRIPRLMNFEIPPSTQRGSVSTIEGVFRTAADNLEELQPERLRLGDIDNFHRCRTAIRNLRHFASAGVKSEEEGEEEDDDLEDLISPIFPLEIVLDDPAGNSFVENFLAPAPDPNLISVRYNRTPLQDMSLGLQPSQEAIESGTIDDDNPMHKNIANTAPHAIGKHTIETSLTPAKHISNRNRERDDAISSELGGVGRQEVMKFTTLCSNCYQPTETDMCVVDIPHFKEVIIMSMLCELCGYRSNEIKGGGGIPKFGNRITLCVKSMDDLAREVLKSDTAGIEIPEIELVLDEGGLDGLYTTIEGLINKIHGRLESANPFGSGDSTTKHHLTNDGGSFSEPIHSRYREFLNQLKRMSAGEFLPFTIIISDPLSNSFVGPVPKDAVALSLQAEKDGQNGCYDAYIDAGMSVAEYERTFEQNEILGLNDMKTENYSSTGTQNYGTDQMEDVPDRIRRIDVRGPDHPHPVGKAPVDNDTTVMGAGSMNFAVPSIGQRGTKVTSVSVTNTDTTNPSSSSAISPDTCNLSMLIESHERDDANFSPLETFDASRPNMVFKNGVQGLGFYTDRPLLDLWKEREECNSS
jgi:zinc finger protein